MKPKVIIVDENDNIVGEKERNDRNQHDIIRIAGIWIENEKNEVLIAQRSFDKNNDPGKWGPAAAGTLEEGETYESNILKEVEEEIGISLYGSDVEFLGAFFEETSHKYFVGIFYAKINSNTEFVLQVEEVESVKWISWEKLEKDILKNPDKYLLSLEHGIMKQLKNWKNKLNFCPCCKNETLSELNSWELCHVCFWEDDGQNDNNADEVFGGPNKELSLAQARLNYKKYGVCDKEFIHLKNKS